MNRAIVYRIGREVIKLHPEVAKDILSRIPHPSRGDIESIPKMFEIYCCKLPVDKDFVIAPNYCQQSTEIKRLFISAMACLFNGKRNFNKTISVTLNQKPSVTTRMLEESVFRYRKDEEFKKRVDQILNTIQNENRAA